MGDDINAVSLTADLSDQKDKGRKFDRMLHKERIMAMFELMFQDDVQPLFEIIKKTPPLDSDEIKTLRAMGFLYNEDMLQKIIIDMRAKCGADISAPSNELLTKVVFVSLLENISQEADDYSLDKGTAVDSDKPFEQLLTKIDKILTLDQMPEDFQQATEIKDLIEEWYKAEAGTTQSQKAKEKSMHVRVNYYIREGIEVPEKLREDFVQYINDNNIYADLKIGDINWDKAQEDREITAPVVSVREITGAAKPTTLVRATDIGVTQEELLSVLLSGDELIKLSDNACNRKRNPFHDMSWTDKNNKKWLLCGDIEADGLVHFKKWAMKGKTVDKSQMFSLTKNDVECEVKPNFGTFMTLKDAIPQCFSKFAYFENMPTMVQVKINEPIVTTLPSTAHKAPTSEAFVLRGVPTESPETSTIPSNVTFAPDTISDEDPNKSGPPNKPADDEPPDTMVQVKINEPIVTTLPSTAHKATTSEAPGLRGVPTEAPETSTIPRNVTFAPDTISDEDPNKSGPPNKPADDEPPDTMVQVKINEPIVTTLPSTAHKATTSEAPGLRGVPTEAPETSTIPRNVTFAPDTISDEDPNKSGPPNKPADDEPPDTMVQVPKNDPMIPAHLLTTAEPSVMAAYARPPNKVTDAISETIPAEPKKVEKPAERLFPIQTAGRSITPNTPKPVPVSDLMLHGGKFRVLIEASLRYITPDGEGVLKGLNNGAYIDIRNSLAIDLVDQLDDTASEDGMTDNDRSLIQKLKKVDDAYHKVVEKQVDVHKKEIDPTELTDEEHKAFREKSPGDKADQQASFFLGFIGKQHELARSDHLLAVKNGDNYDLYFSKNTTINGQLFMAGENYQSKGGSPHNERDRISSNAVSFPVYVDIKNPAAVTQEVVKGKIKHQQELNLLIEFADKVQAHYDAKKHPIVIDPTKTPEYVSSVLEVYKEYKISKNNPCKDYIDTHIKNLTRNMVQDVVGNTPLNSANKDLVDQLKTDAIKEDLKILERRPSNPSIGKLINNQKEQLKHVNDKLPVKTFPPKPT